jgi:methylated-DNA-[protein]-cysteine S-methyltransferase
LANKLDKKLDREQIYNLLSQIPKGKIVTYKEISKKIGTKAYRGVGQIIGANPNAPKIPCHRVVKTDGNLGGYAFGINKKIEILASEGIEVKDNKIVNFKEKLHVF